MIYKGRKLSGPRVLVVPILRSPEDGGNIYLKVQAVVDLEPFTKVCPPPEPPSVILPGGKKRIDFDNPRYNSEMQNWAKKQSAWIALKALEATDGLEWETVQMSHPDTYPNWSKELMSSGFSDFEVQRIITSISEVNGLNENLIEEARQSFLNGDLAQANGQSSRQDEVPTTQSGAPATT